MADKIVQLQDEDGNNIFPLARGLGSDTVSTATIQNGAVTAAKIDLTTLIDKIYPVGSIYMSTNNVSPQTFLGGTWTRIQNTFLIAAGSNYSAGSTGGSASHTHTLSDAGGTAFRNYSTYAYIGRASTAGNIPGDGASYNQYWRWSHNADSSTSSAPYAGYALYGKTDSETTLPPYLSVYIWKRTA